MVLIKKNNPSRRRRRTTPKVSNAVKKYVSNKISKKALTRSVTDSWAVESSVGTLSIWFADDFMALPNVLSRVERLYSYGLRVNYVLHSNSTDTPIMVRMLVIQNYMGRSNGDYKTGTELFSTCLSGAQEQSQNINGTTANLVWRVDTDKYKVHYDKVIPLGISNDGSGGRNYHGNVWIPYKRMLRYEQHATLPTKDNLAVLFLPIETPNDTTTGRFIEVTANCSWYFTY